MKPALGAARRQGQPSHWRIIAGSATGDGHTVRARCSSLRPSWSMFKALRDQAGPGNTKPERTLRDTDRGLWLISRPAVDLQWPARVETHLSHVLPPGVWSGPGSVSDVNVNRCHPELTKGPDVDELTVRPEAVSVAVFRDPVGSPLCRRPPQIELEVVGLDLTAPPAFRAHKPPVSQAAVQGSNSRCLRAARSAAGGIRRSRCGGSLTCRPHRKGCRSSRSVARRAWHASRSDLWSAAPVADLRSSGVSRTPPSCRSSAPCRARCSLWSRTGRAD